MKITAKSQPAVVVKCENCVFFVADHLQCRRAPPVVHISSSTEGYDDNYREAAYSYCAFTETQADWWCGEFKEKQ